MNRDLEDENGTLIKEGLTAERVALIKNKMNDIEKEICTEWPGVMLYGRRR